jgi:hypothetical protein
MCILEAAIAHKWVLHPIFAANRIRLIGPFIKEVALPSSSAVFRSTFNELKKRRKLSQECTFAFKKRLFKKHRKCKKFSIFVF